MATCREQRWVGLPETQGLSILGRQAPLPFREGAGG